MKKVLALALMTLLFASCENIDGKFEAYNTLELRDGNSRDTIRPGKYQAVIKLRKSKVKLKLTDESGSDTYKFKLPGGVDLPTTNGSFSLTSSQVEQPYDVSGKILTDVTMGNLRYERESCQYQEPYTVCYPTGNGGRTCHTEYRTRYGFRDVEYSIRTQDQRISFNLMRPGTSGIEGRFTGREITSERVYQYTGRCW